MNLRWDFCFIFQLSFQWFIQLNLMQHWVELHIRDRIIFNRLWKQPAYWQIWNFQMCSLTMQTCPFIYNVEKMSGPKRSIKITDHFMGTSANVIYCITCTYCKKLHMGETGRRLGDRFREHLHDVEMTMTHPNQSPDILISLIILYSLMQFSAFPYI